MTSPHRAAHARLLALALLAALSAACGHSLPRALGVRRTLVRDELQAMFRAEGMTRGAFVLVELAAAGGATGATATLVNAPMARTRFSPASTFKLPNSLIGLETGAVTEKTVLRWDGKKRWLESWNRDHDLASAIRSSVVWYYQELARRARKERSQALLDAFRYGNQHIGGKVDEYWLDGSLRISALEQLVFLQRLEQGTLPVKPEHLATLRRIMILEETPAYTLRGKSGTGREGDRWVLWLVGSVERAGRRFLYAMVAEAPRTAPFGAMHDARHRVTRALLRATGALPAQL